MTSAGSARGDSKSVNTTSIDFGLGPPTIPPEPSAGASHSTDDRPLDHEALLTLARKVEAAARDDDHERLTVAVQRLSDALVDHLSAERPQLARLPPGPGHLLEDGQERILELLADIARVVAQSPTPDPRYGVNLVRQVSAELSLQAEHERLAGIAAQRLSQ